MRAVTTISFLKVTEVDTMDLLFVGCRYMYSPFADIYLETRIIPVGEIFTG